VVKAIPFLAQEKIPVILQRIHSLPRANDGGYDEVYTVPAKLKAAGIDFALDIAGDMEPMLARNLGIQAGTATGYGLTEEQAIEAVTLAPARILGLEKQLGSLEVGKNATLIVTDGPITDVRTGKVTKAYISGRAVNIDNKQKVLYRNYATRYGQAIKE
jgi:imidazolonepropionase-like amidohydrolase